MIKSLLDSFGIPSVLKSQAPGSVYAITVDGMGEFCVMVVKEHAEEARRIIEAKADA